MSCKIFFLSCLRHCDRKLIVGTVYCFQIWNKKELNIISRDTSSHIDLIFIETYIYIYIYGMILPRDYCLHTAVCIFVYKNPCAHVQICSIFYVHVLHRYILRVPVGRCVYVNEYMCVPCCIAFVCVRIAIYIYIYIYIRLCI